ncbi:MAG: MFS transporter [Hamadaea sp.]|nr:MFS transporter [Hamadaea sp.]NUR52496.1 MFS transporter [Hamadaea sp.]NUT07236.1 MFS transporter [Hamadaea sp.]
MMIEKSPTAQHPLWMIVGPALGTMLAAYQIGALIGPLRETLERDMGYSTTVNLIVLMIHFLALGVGVVPGLLLGRRAPNAVAAPAIGLMLIGVVLLALAPAAFMVMAASLFIGFGSGAVLGTALALAGQAGARRTAMLIAVAAVAFVGLLFGLVLGWFLTTALSWRWVYFLAVPMALVSLVVTGAGGIVALTKKPA